ncbi:MAG: hypothetical protein AB8I08_14530 [Sandaracinaceae bacterium]
MTPETGVWLAALGGFFFLVTRLSLPRLSGLPFGLAGRSALRLSVANAGGAGLAGGFLGWATEPAWGLTAALMSGALGLGRIAHQLRVPRAIARALAHLVPGELVRIATAARPEEEDRGSTAGQTWALWILGTLEALQDAGVRHDEAALLAMLDNYPLNPILSALHRTMAAYYLLRAGDREKARWALTMDLSDASEGLMARVDALTALLDAVDGDVSAAGRRLDRWMRPEGWSKRIREMARANVLAAEDDSATRVALDNIELRWGAGGLEEIRALDGPAASWLEPTNPTPPA